VARLGDGRDEPGLSATRQWPLMRRPMTVLRSR